MTNTNIVKEVAESDFDVCDCGDFRRDHVGGTGQCWMPDDRCHGFRPCLSFRLHQRAHLQGNPAVMTEVSQRAREAAKECGPLGPYIGKNYGEKSDKEWWDNYWSGKYDHLRHIIHFARFEAESTAGLVEALKQVVEATKYVDNSYARDANRIAREAIRQHGERERERPSDRDAPSRLRL